MENCDSEPLFSVDSIMTQTPAQKYQAKAEIKVSRIFILSEKSQKKSEVCFHPMFFVEYPWMLKLKNLRTLFL